MTHANNINLLRLLAATQVVVSHSIGHFDLASENAPLVLAIRMFPGVPIFFLLSGYLIFNAWERDPNIWRYWINRALRIYPGLWGSFTVTIGVLIALGQLDGSPAEMIVWIIAQLSIVQFFNPEFLRDFGTGVVNGALWSIPVELQFYIVLPFCAILFRNTRSALVAIVVAVAINTIFFQYESENAASKLLGVSVFPYLIFFFIGVCFAKYGWMLKISKSRRTFWFAVAYFSIYWLAAFALGYSQSGRTLSPLVAPALAFLIFSAAFGKKINIGWFDRNDVSYGVYLYHMIFINAALYLGLGSVPAVALVFACTFLAAALSWLIVEKNALNMKRRISAPRATTARGTG